MIWKKDSSWIMSVFVFIPWITVQTYLFHLQMRILSLCIAINLNIYN